MVYIRSHNRGRRPQARDISSIGVGPMRGDNFSIFRTNCAIAWGRGFSWEDFRGCRAAKMASEIPGIVLCFSVLAHNSTPLWLLEFWLSCSNWSEDNTEFRYVPLYIADQVVFRSFFYKNFTLLLSKLHKCKRLTAYP